MIRLNLLRISVILVIATKELESIFRFRVKPGIHHLTPSIKYYRVVSSI